MIKNPYNPSNPVDPRYYANQKELLATFRETVNSVTKSGGVTKPINLAIIGQWGMGKSSTLSKFDEILQNEFNDIQTLSSVITLKPAYCEDPDIFCANILESLFKSYRATIPLPRQVLDFIRDELIILDEWKLKKISLTSPEIERNEQKVTAINFTDTLLRFWDKLRGNDVRLVIIMMDDIHYVMDKQRGDIYYNLRTDIQTLGKKGVPFMFIISTSDMLYPIIQDIAEPFTRLFVRHELGLFTLEGTEEQITKPLVVEAIHLKISQTVIKKLHEITKGHPYFVTLLMRELLTKLPENITVIEDFDQYCPDVIEILAKKKFDADFASVTDAEKEILLKIVELRKDEFTPKEIGGRPKAPLLDRLVNKKLVQKVGRGKYQLYTPMFGEYLLRKKE